MKKTRLTRIFALLLCAMLSITLLPSEAWAAEESDALSAEMSVPADLRFILETRQRDLSVGSCAFFFPALNTAKKLPTGL